MASIQAFRAYRPPSDIADRVVTRTADTYSSRERRELLNKFPESFMHVIFPEAGKKRKETLPNSKERFEKVREQFDTFHEKGNLIREEEPALYLYELRTNEKTFFGLIGAASVEDLEENRIKKHEQTLEKREELLKEYLKVCDINADPVLLAHPPDAELSEIIEKIRQEEATYDFETQDDQRHHRLWPIRDQEWIKKIREIFAGMDSLYISDGHHRSASSLRLAQEMRRTLENPHPEAGYEAFMAYFLPEDQLSIHGYYRCITDLNGYSEKEFLKHLEKDFQVIPTKGPVAADTLHEFGLYLDGNWYLLYPDPSRFDHRDPVGSLDASILYDLVLAPILGVEDPRNSERVHFHGAPKGMDPMLRDLKKGTYRVAFTLAPVPIEQLKEVADQGKNMPPKTTWIEPKLRSGLLIYRAGLHGS